MKTIPLTKGMVALVDDEDYEFLSHWKWYATSCNGKFYAKRDQDVKTVRTRTYMHRAIAGAVKGQYVDHKDGCTLNNQRSNIRLCTQSENMLNAVLSSRSTTGFKGVCFDKSRGNYIAHFRGKNIGRFKTPREAAEFYDETCIKHGGNFALTNRALNLMM